MVAIAGPHPNPSKAALGQRLHKLEVDATAAPIVQRIFAEYLGGAGLYAIAEGLTCDGVPTRREPRAAAMAGDARTPSRRPRWRRRVSPRVGEVAPRQGERAARVEKVVQRAGEPALSAVPSWRPRRSHGRRPRRTWHPHVPARHTLHRPGSQPPAKDLPGRLASARAEGPGTLAHAVWPGLPTTSFGVAFGSFGPVRTVGARPASR